VENISGLSGSAKALSLKNPLTYSTSYSGFITGTVGDCTITAALS
jgi:hypothetical protein